ncbi:geranylgeranyl reductase family protein [Jatrophihabitans telluris]|uniref:Geranylgeranyl reductase family protein n=1 Tax=Jatrophihabitans telluris TaxID=2038343 RepID=A0ABY4QZM3_9ACTN|nr:geranylgeranyl reductase family protein [Jatrophihabitans telluris]UQX89059.1 geranylgeranyl reductase family protein [Jatrophihabitans telluris]
MNERSWDVAVIGAGPAGAAAAWTAAQAGARVLILERERLPRYKLCGGGLIGPSLAALPPGFTPASRDSIHAVRFTHRGRAGRTRRGPGPLIELIDRPTFDAGLVDRAREAGAQLRDGVSVRDLHDDGELVTLSTDGGPVRARFVVGADGSAGRSSRLVGVQFDQVDLGLEHELPVAGELRDSWRGMVHLDWGPLPGSYGWVFPKDDYLTVGVIGARERGVELKAYLADFVGQLGLDGIEPRHSGGHLTRCRSEDSPLARGRVLVAGDAAGFLEPFTREGISFALRSGAIAGSIAAQLAHGTLATAAAEAEYLDQVRESLVREMVAGQAFMRAYERRPAVFHAAIVALPPAWSAFGDIVAGRATLADALEHRWVRAILGRQA